MTLNPPSDPQDLGAIVRSFLTNSYCPMMELFTEGFLTSRRMLDEYLMYVPGPAVAGRGSARACPRLTGTRRSERALPSSSPTDV